MTAGVPVVAMLDLGMMLLKLLAVLGGAALGGLLFGLLLRLLAKLLYRRQVPRPILRIVQGLGAVAVGSLVWLWAFGQGGGGFGFGGGLGLGDGKGEGPGPVATARSTAKEETPAADDAGPPGAVTLRVEMLGGAQVEDQRFYLMEGEKEPRNLADLRSALRERRQRKDQGSLKGIEIVIYQTSVAQDHPAVRDLEKWARENDLAVSLRFPKRDAP